MTTPARQNRKTLEGHVVSDKVSKTRIVEVNWRRRHPLYEKVLLGKTRLHVHDEENKTKSGDQVVIQETRPISRLKRWRIIQVLSKPS
jgi:small subunit ribosomal protein S17